VKVASRNFQRYRDYARLASVLGLALLISLDGHTQSHNTPRREPSSDNRREQIQQLNDLLQNGLGATTDFYRPESFGFETSSGKFWWRFSKPNQPDPAHFCHRDGGYLDFVKLGVRFSDLDINSVKSVADNGHYILQVSCKNNAECVERWRLTHCGFVPRFDEAEAEHEPKFFTLVGGGTTDMTFDGRDSLIRINTTGDQADTARAIALLREILGPASSGEVASAAAATAEAAATARRKRLEEAVEDELFGNDHAAEAITRETEVREGIRTHYQYESDRPFTAENELWSRNGYLKECTAARDSWRRALENAEAAAADSTIIERLKAKLVVGAGITCTPNNGPGSGQLCAANGTSENIYVVRNDPTRTGRPFTANCELQ
jgi:hypothetical protein